MPLAVFSALAGGAATSGGGGSPGFATTAPASVAPPSDPAAPWGLQPVVAPAARSVSERAKTHRERKSVVIVAGTGARLGRADKRLRIDIHDALLLPGEHQRAHQAVVDRAISGCAAHEKHGQGRVVGRDREARHARHPLDERLAKLDVSNPPELQRVDPLRKETRLDLDSSRRQLPPG